jgi:hypothetical protein
MATLIWLLGVTGLATMVLGSVIRYRRICSRAADVDTSTNELLQHCKQLLEMRQRVRLLETSRIASPIVVGFWRPTLLLPRNFTCQVSRKQLRLVLLHELTHVKRQDIAANWLISAVQIAHWFNPLVWYALKVMRRDMEQACDASVLRHLSAREHIEYGDTLIKLSDLAPQQTLLVQNASVIESRSQLQSRIRTITQYQPHRTASTVLGAALIAVLGAIGLTQAANAPPSPQIGPVAQAAPVPAPAPAATPRPADSPQVKAPPAAPRATPAAAEKAEASPQLESVTFPIKYNKAEQVVSFIRSAPGSGLLSFHGSIGFDDRANTILVQDSPDNVSTIRQLISTLDVPIQQIYGEVYVVVADSALLQEIKAAMSEGGPSSPVTVLGPGQDILEALERAQRAGRAEIISAPRMVIANRSQASVQQGMDLPPLDGDPSGPPKLLQFTMKLTPEFSPNQTLVLAIDTTLESKVTPVNTSVPSIDSSQVTTRIVLDTGAAVLLDMTSQVRKTPPDTDAGSARRFVAFVIPRLLRDPTGSR